MTISTVCAELGGYLALGVIFLLIVLRVFATPPGYLPAPTTDPNDDAAAAELLATLDREPATIKLTTGDPETMTSQTTLNRTPLAEVGGSRP